MVFILEIPVLQVEVHLSAQMIRKLYFNLQLQLKSGFATWTENAHSTMLASVVHGQ